MRSAKFRSMLCMPVAALILSGSPLVAAPSVSAVGPPVGQSETARASAQASHLLEEIQLIAHELRRDAATLESFRYSGLGWDSHARQLALAREHINNIGARLEKLRALRNSAEPWQQNAIDAMTPVALQLAARTENAIAHLNNSPHQLLDPAYTSHLSAIADHAGRIKDSAGLFLELGNTEERLNTLRDRVAAAESRS